MWVFWGFSLNKTLFYKWKKMGSHWKKISADAINNILMSKRKNILRKVFSLPRGHSKSESWANVTPISSRHATAQPSDNSILGFI